MIDPRAIRTFLAVVRSNSISGGARSLNISQPSVSNAIAQLEQALGVSLFERSRSGILLTAEGEALLRRAESIDSLLRDAEAEVKLASTGVLGPLRVGGTPGALVSLLPDAVRSLEARIGRFTLHVVERPDHDLAAMLHRGEIELAFVTTGIEQPPEGIEERTFSRDPFALIVGRQNDHLPARLSLKTMMATRWVLPEARGAFRRQIDALFMAADIPVPQDIIRCDSLLTTKAIVRGSQRVTILPMQVASAELSIGVLRAITIEEAEFSRSIGVRRLAGGRLSRLAAEMLETLIHSSSL
ncbi:LysR family transcriptional regulator [Sphingobium sp. SA2]|jgi:LysR family transcriptional regulator of abg operon|uniref:LysR family transcriptional regulator n=1 Tax=unclassified Sphingobium TaxID=2611147 RepID=UPI0005037E66|nr:MULTISPECIES: LysR family transcriptional regulator [unclassified Sphingobium]KFL44729.1 LysR-family transcriptional regulator [Sphingobium sp. ba1]MDT7532783.1 LysR family transcriptional regulator [Sphingobium sp. SA2]|tara:strand:- start:1236 stop:2132 length:897 start_codon:yes stop_codon:yes gene_type:complete